MSRTSWRRFSTIINRRWRTFIILAINRHWWFTTIACVCLTGIVMVRWQGRFIHITVTILLMSMSSILVAIFCSWTRNTFPSLIRSTAWIFFWMFTISIKQTICTISWLLWSRFTTTWHIFAIIVIIGHIICWSWNSSKSVKYKNIIKTKIIFLKTDLPYINECTFSYILKLNNYHKK